MKKLLVTQSGSKIVNELNLIIRSLSYTSYIKGYVKEDDGIKDRAR